MLPETLERVINGFQRFPGIGMKTARRLGFYALTLEPEEIKSFSTALQDLTEKVIECPECFNITEITPCLLCRDESREKHLLCIVETSSDIPLLEQTGYKGMYHVLGGVLSPLDGIGVESLHLQELPEKVETVNEIIIATNVSIEGETTALYIVNLLADKKIKITRLARGLPTGGHLEYVDELTLTRSLEERVEISE